jgi:hypothetical protein
MKVLIELYCLQANSVKLARIAAKIAKDAGFFADIRRIPGSIDRTNAEQTADILPASLDEMPSYDVHIGISARYSRLPKSAKPFLHGCNELFAQGAFAHTFGTVIKVPAKHEPDSDWLTEKVARIEALIAHAGNHGKAVQA